MCNYDTAAEAVPAANPAGGDGGAPASPELIDELVMANHILFDQGVLDGFGHVSVRHDRAPDRFLLARSMAPGTVRAEDILEFTLDGAPVGAHGQAVYVERFIHSEIYRAHPRAVAIVHSHSPSLLPLTVVPSVPLRALSHMAGFIGEGAPLFDIRDVAGPATDLLIRSAPLGEALAACLADNDIVLMRGHGSTLIAASLRQAVYRAVYAEANAHCQLQAMALGEVVWLSAEEAAICEAGQEAHVDRPWVLWREQVLQKRRAHIDPSHHKE